MPNCSNIHKTMSTTNNHVIPNTFSNCQFNRMKNNAINKMDTIT